MKRKLRLKLAPSGAASAGLPQPEWHVGELLATWTRPQFEPHVYPYCPPHVTRPVETRRVFIVHLPEKCFFSVRAATVVLCCIVRKTRSAADGVVHALQVPKNLKLLAVPLMELHSGSAKFGVELSSVPVLLSRFNVILHSADDAATQKQ